jgi:hypothetical protein
VENVSSVFGAEMIWMEDGLYIRNGGHGGQGQR